jgi:hypothetical protein
LSERYIPIEFDYTDIDIDPIEIPVSPPVPVDTDTSGSVVSGDSSTGTAQSLQYELSGIKAMAWAQEPHRVIWAVRSDGLLVGCTYRRDQGVLAWHRHPMTNGAIEDVAVIPNAETGRAQVWMVVQRVIDGETKRYIEYMTEPHEPSGATDTEDYIYLDSSLTYSGSAVTTVSNLDHLEGQTVSIWADGARHADKTVSSGSVTLDRSASKVHVGIHTSSFIRTLPAEAGAANGTAQGKTKQVARVKCRLIETIAGKAGRNLTELDELNVRTSADAMDASPALKSGIHETLMDASFDQEGQFYIAQDIPAPMTIAALMPEFDGADY